MSALGMWKYFFKSVCVVAAQQCVGQRWEQNSKTLCDSGRCYSCTSYFMYVVCEMHCGNLCIYSPRVTVTKHHKHTFSHHFVWYNNLMLLGKMQHMWDIILNKTLNTFYTNSSWIHCVRKREENWTLSNINLWVYRPLNCRMNYVSVDLCFTAIINSHFAD